MSLAERAKHQARLLGRLSQNSAYDMFRDAYFDSDDFSDFDTTDEWTLTQATAGTGAVVAGAGGLLALDSASSTADQGVQVQRNASCILPAAGKPIIYECRFKVTDLANNCQLFLGLSDIDTTILAAGDLASSDCVGFVSDTATIAATAGSLDLFSVKATVEGQVVAPHTMVEDTFFTIGFYVDGLTAVTPLLNGEPGTPLTTGGTHIPVLPMAPSFACLSEGTVDPILTVDWYYLLQVR